jgi:hypothetical protein
MRHVHGGPRAIHAAESGRKRRKATYLPALLRDSLDQQYIGATIRMPPERNARHELIYMGQAKSRIDRLLVANPTCCYCGGRATSEEHCPPKIMFIDSIRPKGWEFSSCAGCNTGSRQSDQVFALFVLSNLVDPAPVQEAHLQKIMRGVNNNARYVVDEILDNSQIPPALINAPFPWNAPHVPVVLGDKMDAHLQLVFDKLLLSAHFQLHGCVAPRGCLVDHHAISNSDIMAGKLQQIPAWFQGVSQLNQGKFSSEGQFEYQHAIGPDGTLAMKFIFHRSAVLFSLFLPSAEEAMRLAPTAAKMFRAPVFHARDPGQDGTSFAA